MSKLTRFRQRRFPFDGFDAAGPLRMLRSRCFFGFMRPTECPTSTLTLFQTDFRNDLYIDVFIDVVERSALIWVDEMKGRGLLNFSINRVWNKGGVFRVIMTYGYMNKAAYEANVAFIETTFDCSKK